ncbi:MAG: MauE/DoxX family redox-associated membrane protein [Usitatibacteraceae bacterium]
MVIARVSLVLRWAFVLLLLGSASGKLLDMAGFIAVVETYQSLPRSLTPAAAWGLVAVELIVSVWLAFSVASRLAALAVVALHAMYFAWIGSALLRDLSLSNCGCFGVYLARPLTGWTLLEDGILLALATILCRNTRERD